MSGIYTTKKSPPSILGLKDVSTDNLQDNDVLLYNATTERWENGIVGGGDAIELVATNNLVSKLGTAGANLNSGATENILLGLNAGNALTGGDKNVCIGSNTGTKITTGIDNILIGSNAGVNTSTTTNYVIGIGNYSAAGGAGNGSISIGGTAGTQNAGNESINIGSEAGRFYNNSVEGYECINIGRLAGRNQPKAHCVNIGRQAGQNNNSDDAINIGNEAGKARSGLSSINLGKFANQTNGTTHNQAIVINATGANVPSVANDTFVVKPIRGVAHGLGVGVMKYDPATAEITYSTT